MRASLNLLIVLVCACSNPATPGATTPEGCAAPHVSVSTVEPREGAREEGANEGAANEGAANEGGPRAEVEASNTSGGDVRVAQRQCNPGSPWHREGDDWALEPDLRFEVDSSRLSAESDATLRSALDLLPEGQRVQAFVDAHPNVIARFADRSLNLPEHRARALAAALGERAAEALVRSRPDENRNGPPSVRFAFPDCRY